MEKDQQELHLTITDNASIQDEYYLSQNELRQMLKEFRLDNNLSFEVLGKLAEIDPDILQAYEDGQFNLRPEAYNIIMLAYASLNDNFKVNH